MSVECDYNTSKDSIRGLLDSLLRGSVLNYVGHRACVHKARKSARLSKSIIDLSKLLKRQKQAGGQEENHLHRATRNGAWLSVETHRLNGTELSQEEFRDNLCLRYGLMPKDISVTCDGCGKKFLIEHALSCPMGGLVLGGHNDAAK